MRERKYRKLWKRSLFKGSLVCIPPPPPKSSQAASWCLCWLPRLPLARSGSKGGGPPEKRLQATTKFSADAARCVDAETSAQQLEEDAFKFKSESRSQRRRFAELQDELANGRSV